MIEIVFNYNDPEIEKIKDEYLKQEVRPLVWGNVNLGDYIASAIQQQYCDHVPKVKLILDLKKVHKVRDE